MKIKVILQLAFFSFLFSMNYACKADVLQAGVFADAGELNPNLPLASQQHITVAGDAARHASTRYYVDVLPGFYLDHKAGLVFGVLGAGYSHSSFDSAARALDQPMGYMGYRVGLGYQVVVNRKFSAGMKYVYSDYSDPLGPTNQAISLNLSYAFDGEHNSDD